MSFGGRAGSCILLLLAAVACKSPPSTSERKAPTGTSSAASTSTDECRTLRKTVVGEAAKLAACTTNDDCKVHRLSVCDFHELGCYAAYINKTGDTTPLDKAVSEYAKTCSLTKCKCEMPEKSVCKNGACTGE